MRSLFPDVTGVLLFRTAVLGDNSVLPWGRGMKRREFIGMLGGAADRQYIVSVIIALCR
jgi:hypothetical protein